jgi:hypothetical protein
VRLERGPWNLATSRPPLRTSHQGFGTPHRARSEAIPVSLTRLNRTGVIARKRCGNQPLTRVTVLFADDRDDYLDDVPAKLADLGVRQVLAVR